MTRGLAEGQRLTCNHLGVALVGGHPESPEGGPSGRRQMLTPYLYRIVGSSSLSIFFLEAA
jgi:hypothetical protein